MKKLSYLFISIISFIGINCVNADTSYDVYYQQEDCSNCNISSKSFYLDFYDNNSDVISNFIISSINDYNSNFSSYPYFIVSGIPSDDITSNIVMNFYVLETQEIPSIDITSFPNNISLSYVAKSSIIFNKSSGVISSSSSLTSDTGSFPIYYYFNDASVGSKRRFLSQNYFFSNFDYKFLSSSSSSINYHVEMIDHHFLSNISSPIPSFYNYLNLDFLSDYVNHTYTEINLNNFSYVALSLKDYSLRNDNINQFSTNIYTKGQLCLTPVYDYGMKEKTEYYSGYQVDRCSVVYDDFTPVRTYILKQDLENNAIYYLKAYDTSIENKVKVDTNIFNISYITSENADNPSVNVNGRNYPTIAYDDLSSSSTQSEEQGYVSGQSTNVLEQFDENFINNFFSSPLNILKSVWGAIVSMLSLITMFIALLPATLQGFLYMSFALAIILGIIKILL